MNFKTEFMTGKTYSKFIFIFSLALVSLVTFANAPLASKLHIGMFKNSKTCVVTEGGINFYNAAIKDAIEKYWKVTEYEFIDETEFEKRKTNPKYSFIVLMDGAFDKDPAGVSYNYISLVLGDASGNLTKMPEFCSIPLRYTGDTEIEYEYVIPSVVKFMQLHVKNLEKDRLLISINGLKYYNKAEINNRELLMNKDKMAANADTPEKIKTVYLSNVKLLTTDEIQKELTIGNKLTVFHFHVGPPPNAGAGKCFEMLFDPEGNLYYYNSRKITNDNADGFNLNDFNNIK